MDVDNIISTCCADFSELTQKDFRRWIGGVQPHFDGREPSEVLQDKKTVILMFAISNYNGISRIQYQKIKRYLTILFKYFNVDGAIPSREEVLEIQTQNKYFKDLDDVLGFIDRVGSLRWLDYNSESDLCVVKAISIFGWHGLSLSEISKLEKSHIQKREDQTIIKSGEKQIALSGRAERIVNYLSISDGHRGFPSGKLQNYKGDPKFLFRPSKSDKDLNDVGIAQILQRFNEEIPIHLNKRIDFRLLSKNRIFNDIYEDDTQETLFNKIARHFGCNQAVASGYKTEYFFWLKRFHPGT